MNRLISFACLITIMISCSQSQQSVGPFFGNGFRNGWADQHSITLWTRLTENPDMNVNGREFTPLTKEVQRELAKVTDKALLHSKQIPEGLTLSDMEGACPGTSGQVKLNYFAENNPGDKVQTDWVNVDADKNFTKQWKLNDLVSDTRYKVEIFSRKGEGTEISDTVSGMFVTAPKKSTAKDIRFTVVTGHDFNRKDSPSGHKIYDAMIKENLDFYVHTGDIEYYDKPNPWAYTEDLMRFKWDRLFALPFQRNFYNKTTSYFIKDDHDVLRNDAYQGMTYGTVSFDRGLEIFDQEQFPSTDTTYKTIRWGKDLQIWILEGRRYRSKNTDEDGPEKTILGEAQKEWLFSTINASDAAAKVIVSATPILGPDRAKGKNDNHSNKAFQHEGDELRDFINQPENVFITCGDRHWQYVTHFEGTNLWEFSSGPGSNQHAGGWSQDDIYPEHQFLRVKGGYLLGSLYHENDTVKLKFEHHDVDGNVVNEQIFKL
jgi:alkaline phosphatase D